MISLVNIVNPKKASKFPCHIQLFEAAWFDRAGVPAPLRRLKSALAVRRLSR